MNKLPRLGVNIDHVATLRQARGVSYPSLKNAARICLEQECEQITIHLREDRRHIQDQDVFDIKEITNEFNVPLNLELSTSDSVLETALKALPDWVCLVPEKREEKTTEGGLNLHDQSIQNKIYSTCELLKEKIDNVKISLFIEADNKIIDSIPTQLVDAIEIHTGSYAHAFLDNKSVKNYEEQFKRSFESAMNKNINYHAGHGLDDKMLTELLKLKIFSEYNIGHWIISQSIFESLENVVKRLKNIIKEAL